MIMIISIAVVIIIVVVIIICLLVLVFIYIHIYISHDISHCTIPWYMCVNIVSVYKYIYIIHTEYIA